MPHCEPDLRHTLKWDYCDFGWMSIMAGPAPQKVWHEWLGNLLLETEQLIKPTIFLKALLLHRPQLTGYFKEYYTYSTPSLIQSQLASSCCNEKPIRTFSGADPGGVECVDFHPPPSASVSNSKVPNQFYNNYCVPKLHKNAPYSIFFQKISWGRTPRLLQLFITELWPKS